LTNPKINRYILTLCQGDFFTVIYHYLLHLPKIGSSSDSSNYPGRVVLAIIDLFVVLEFTKATLEFSHPKPSPSESRPKVSGANTVKFL
jgi:hypothetical protein